jgi:hypothetical protein
MSTSFDAATPFYFLLPPLSINPLKKSIVPDDSDGLFYPDGLGPLI